MDDIKIAIRPADPSDKDLIMASWLQGQYHGSPDYFKTMREEIFYACYSCVVKNILFTPGVTVVMACDKDNPMWVAGFCVFKDSDVYWIFVKPDYRNRGIARLMMPDPKGAKVLIDSRCLTKPGRAIVRKQQLKVSSF